jgi:UDP-sugar transporter A1/2/3
MLASVVLVLMESESFGIGVQGIFDTFSQWDVLQAAVPSLIYTFQNNLTFYSLEYLSAAEMQVLYQMKVLTTAGLSVIILGKVLNASKWTACFMLVIGIALVQWPRGDEGTQILSGDLGHALSSGKVKGFLAVLAGCSTKAFASVFIEKLLKHTEASVWMRNVQFGFFGALISCGMAFLEDGPKIQEAGFTQGYTARVIVVILVNANGGLLVAAMLKYAGATLGCFSTALSIILTCVISATVLQDSTPDYYFLAGTMVTVGSALLYGLGWPHWMQDSCKGCCCGDCQASDRNSAV